MRIPANPGLLTWRHRGGGGSFRPYGDLYFVGALRNPRIWQSPGGLAARIIVGFNVGDKPKWELKDVIPIVKRVRKEQGYPPNSTFVLQEGLYQHREPEKGVVQEKGTQVIIIDEWGTPPEQFDREMVELAETLARELQQKEVILEIQERGITQSVSGVAP